MGIFLHDIGKVRELSYAKAFAYTDEGQLIGHIVIGVEMLDEKAAKVPDLTGEPFPTELLLRLKHMILSHHGTYEFGAAKLPMTPEAIALHYLDNLDAKIHSFTRDIREDRNQSSAWTPYNQSIQRRLFKGSTEGSEPTYCVAARSGGLRYVDPDLPQARRGSNSTRATGWWAKLALICRICYSCFRPEAVLSQLLPAGLAMTPTSSPAAPKADDKPSLVPPDEQFWVRYSPHHEFPLSSVGTVCLYAVLAVLIWVAAKFLPLLMTNSEPIPVEPIELVAGGGGGDPNGTGAERGKEQPAEDLGQEDPQKLAEKHKPDVPLAELPKVDW